MRGDIGGARLKVDVEIGRVGFDDLAIVAVHRLDCLHFCHHFFFGHLQRGGGGGGGGGGGAELSAY